MTKTKTKKRNIVSVESQKQNHKKRGDESHTMKNDQRKPNEKDDKKFTEIQTRLETVMIDRKTKKPLPEPKPLKQEEREKREKEEEKEKEKEEKRELNEKKERMNGVLGDLSKHQLKSLLLRWVLDREPWHRANLRSTCWLWSILVPRVSDPASAASEASMLEWHFALDAFHFSLNFAQKKPSKVFG